MVVVGLTGGIGSGKSTVAAALADRGATVIDADRIAREVVEPGGPAYHAVLDRFGPSILEADGRLDRQALAGVVFADADARRDLNAITHPAIGQVMTEQLAGQAGGDGVVVLDIPLLTPETRARWPFDGVIVVDAPEDVAVRRLVDQRGFDPSDARARIGAQLSREERRSLAGLVIDNAGDRAALAAQVERAWAWIQTLARGG